MNPTSSAELLLRDLVVEVVALRSDIEVLHAEVQYARAALDEILGHMKALVSQR